MTNPDSHIKEQLFSLGGGVKVYGAATLERYTDKILVEGFKKLAKSGQAVCPGSIYQIHGSVSATSDDETIIVLLQKELAENPDNPVVVLLHRPDEIQDRLPHLQELMTESPRIFGLVFLGDMHIDDQFYATSMAKKKIIPHCFFDVISTPLKSDIIVIGTHTTWGDMRDPIHVLKILGEVFRLSPDKPAYGYLGGKPANELDLNTLRKTFVRFFPDVEVDFQDAHSFQELRPTDKRNIIFVDTKNQQPDSLEITFNTQLYFYGDKVRTGESSGSLHAGVNIPVILEMNGSEKIERLDVIKVPYDTHTMAIKSADFSRAAALINDVINSGSYITSLKNNLEQAQNFNNVHVTTQLNELMCELHPEYSH